MSARRDVVSVAPTNQIFFHDGNPSPLPSLVNLPPSLSRGPAGCQSPPPKHADGHPDPTPWQPQESSLVPDAHIASCFIARVSSSTADILTPPHPPPAPLRNSEQGSHPLFGVWGSGSHPSANGRNLSAVPPSAQMDPARPSCINRVYYFLHKPSPSIPLLSSPPSPSSFPLPALPCIAVRLFNCYCVPLGAITPPLDPPRF